jgi:small subunit ribosomal protein S24e
MIDAAVTIRTRKVFINHSLQRKHIVVDIIHSGRSNISKNGFRSMIGMMYKVNKVVISVFGCKTHFGGGKTAGFSLIYDSIEALMKFEPMHRLVYIDLAKPPPWEPCSRCKLKKGKRVARKKVHGIKKAQVHIAVSCLHVEIIDLFVCLRIKYIVRKR